MTTYYVDWEKADNTGNGLTLATAKKTLNGAEDIPVVAGDFVWVRPGVYRETLTVDVSGSNGSPITYQGDVAGQIWHPGGVVRVTDSDNDQVPVGREGISSSNKSYRTFRGFTFDTGNYGGIFLADTGGQNWIIEDCVISMEESSGIYFGSSVINTIVRRCLFFSIGISAGVNYFHSSTLDNANHQVENCIFLGGGTSGCEGVNTQRVGGIDIKNCLFIGISDAVRIQVDLGSGQTIDVSNSIFQGCNYALQTSLMSVGLIVEDYNTFFANNNKLGGSRVTEGDNSVLYTPLLDTPILKAGHRFPWHPGELSLWSPVARRTDDGSAPSDDLYGLTRPVTNGKRSWGPIQFTGAVRETTITDGGGASLKLPDAGEQFFMRVPTSASEITIAVKVYREADYAGTLPQLIVRQPGQADETDTDAGSAEQFNTLSVTLTPDALPPWVDVFIKSNNTAAAGDFATFWDTLTVT